MLEHDILTGSREKIYDMSVEKDGSAFTLATSEKVAEQVFETLSSPNARIIPILEKNLRLPPFVAPDGHSEWGFARRVRTNSKGSEVELICDLPRPDEASGHDYHQYFAVSANLKLIFACLSFSKADTESSQKQLFHVDMDTQYGLNGASIHATFGKDLMPWLSSRPDNFYDYEIEEVMQRVYGYMTGRQTNAAYFRAWFRRPKLVSFNCPGNACNLNPDSHTDDRLNIGYRLSPHNVDNVDQQLTLLSGVIAMTEKARKSIGDL